MRRFCIILGCAASFAAIYVAIFWYRHPSVSFHNDGVVIGWSEIKFPAKLEDFVVVLGEPDAKSSCYATWNKRGFQVGFDPTTNTVNQFLVCVGSAVGTEYFWLWPTGHAKGNVLLPGGTISRTSSWDDLIAAGLELNVFESKENEYLYFEGSAGNSKLVVLRKDNCVMGACFEYVSHVGTEWQRRKSSLFEQPRSSRLHRAKELLVLAENKLVPSFVERANSADLIAWQYHFLGDFENTEAEFLRVLEQHEQFYGPKSLLLIPELGEIAFFYEVNERIDKTIPIHQRILEIRESKEKKDDATIVECLELLANAYRRNGELEKAGEFYDRAINLTDNVGDDRMRLLASLNNNKALLFRDQGMYEKAEKTLKDAIQLYEQLIESGDETIAKWVQTPKGTYDFETEGEAYSFFLANSLHSLAAILQVQKQNTKSEQVYLRSLNIFESIVEADSPFRTGVLYDLATLYEQMNRYEEARRYRELVELNRNPLPNVPDMNAMP